MKVLYSDAKVIVVERKHNYREYVVLQDEEYTSMPADEENLINYLNVKGLKKAASYIKKIL